MNERETFLLQLLMALTLRRNIETTRLSGRHVFTTLHVAIAQHYDVLITLHSFLIFFSPSPILVTDMLLHFSSPINALWTKHPSTICTPIISTMHSYTIDWVHTHFLINTHFFFSIPELLLLFSPLFSSFRSKQRLLLQSPQLIAHLQPRMPAQSTQ